MSNIVSAKALTASGSAQTLNVDQSGKYGVFTFEAVQDQLLSLQLSSVAPTNVNISYSLYSLSNTVLVSGTVWNGQKTIHLPKIPLTGTYLIAFRYSSGTFDLTASLELDVELQGNGTSLQQSTPVASQSKRVWFSATAGDDVAFATTDLVLTPSTGRVDVIVVRPDGVTLKSDYCYLNRQPGCAWSMRDLPLSGVYTIVADPNSAVAMNLTLTLSAHMSGVLTPDVPTSLNLAVSGQHALFNFTVTEGQTVALNATAITTSPANERVMLEVFDPAGMSIGTDSRATNPIMNLPYLAAGTYSVLVGAADAATATMQLVLASGMTGVLPVDGTSHSFASTVKQQRGYFIFQGTAGQNVGFAVTNLAISQSGNMAILDVYKPDGGLLDNWSCNPGEDPGCQESRLNLPATGTYRIESYPRHIHGAGEATMAFTLTLSEHLQAALALGSPQSVNLAVPGQYALLSFSASAGQTVAVNANTITTIPANRRVVISVLNSSGASVGSSAGTSTATVNLPNLSAGDYSVLVNAESAGTASAQVVLASGVVGELALNGVGASFATTVKNQNGYFTFDATVGQNIGVGLTDLVITPTTTIANIDIYKPGGGSLMKLSCNVSSVPGCQREAQNLPATGAYHVIASPYGAPPNSSVTMSFTLTLSEHLADVLIPGTPYSLSLAAGRYSLLTFTATAGQSLVLNTNTIATTPSGKFVHVKVVNSSGTSVGSSSGTSSATVNLPSLAAGTYTVLINSTDAATATMQVVLQ